MRNVDRLRSLSSHLQSLCSHRLVLVVLVGVSAEFGTLAGKSLSSTLVGAFSLVGVLTEFGTLGGMLIGYGR